MTSTTETAPTAAEILRRKFKPEEVGALPRITCPKCSKGHCDEGHQKRKCAECGSYITERHIHLDYVGHADVTSRLLEADPEWEWKPVVTDPDPALLAAAIATNNPEIVRLVTENAPPKFETDRNGSPVGLWIWLTVGGVTRRGYGSCPAGQNDAEKVLIGDSLRNAAMRFGVALDLWAKGDRADPSAENATAAGGQANRRRPQQEAANSRRQQDRATETVPLAPAEADPAVIADWGAKIDAITSTEDAAQADAELRDIFKAGRMDATTANAIRNAIKEKASAVAGTPAAPSADDAGYAGRIAGAATQDDLLKVMADIRSANKAGATTEVGGETLTLHAYVMRRRSELEPEMAGAR